MLSSNKEEKYTLIKVENETLNIDLAAQLKHIVKQANDNIIVDASKMNYCLDSQLLVFQDIYEQQFEANKSFIIANMNDEIMEQADDADIELNAVPTLNEAIDLLFMEEIEREL